MRRQAPGRAGAEGEEITSASRLSFTNSYITNREGGWRYGLATGLFAACARIDERRLNALAGLGLVTIDQSQGRSWAMYTITGTGLQKAEEVGDSVAPAIRDYTKNVVSWIKAQSFAGLLRSIYSKYPSFAVNSVFSH